MAKLKNVMLKIAVLAVIVGFGAIYLKFYPYIHSKRVSGQIFGVERVTDPQAIIGTLQPNQLYSFAVAIKTTGGEIFHASSEDRQWAVAKVGMCGEAIFYPYPPWNLEKAGTFHKARLDRLSECPATAAGSSSTGAK